MTFFISDHVASCGVAHNIRALVQTASLTLKTGFCKGIINLEHMRGVCYSR